MIVKVNCYFCREPLQVTTRDTASVEKLPTLRSKVYLRLTSASPKAHDAIVAAVKEMVMHPANEWVARLITIEPAPKIADADIDIVSLGVDSHRVVFGWYPDEMLTALQIAEMCNKSKQVVQNDLRKGRFPNAPKKSKWIPMKDKKMRLRVAPRKDVQAYMVEKKVYTRQ